MPPGGGVFRISIAGCNELIEVSLHGQYFYTKDEVSGQALQTEHKVLSLSFLPLFNFFLNNHIT